MATLDGESRLLLHGVGHELLLRAVRTEYVLPLRDEALSDHGDAAGGADEALVVPVAALERDEAGAADACENVVVVVVVGEEDVVGAHRAE